MRTHIRFVAVLALFSVVSPNFSAADDYQMMRLFNDMTMTQARASNDSVRAGADAQRSLAQANQQNASAYAERMRGRQLEIESKRSQMFLDQAKRDLRLQNRDDMRARKEAEALLKRKSQLTSFFSGRVTAPNTRAFFWSTSRVPYSQSFRDYLGREVQPLGGDQFQSTMPIFEILLPSGELRRPPICLMGRKGTELYENRKDFEEIWARLVNALRYERELDYDHFVAVIERMEKWRCSCADRQLSDVARNDGSLYMKRLSSVAHCLERQKGLDRLEALVKNEGFGFPGGTCGDLLQHIQDWSLQVRSGSQAQLLLAEFGDDCLASIAGEITVAQNGVKPAILSPPPMQR